MAARPLHRGERREVVAAAFGEPAEGARLRSVDACASADAASASAIAARFSDRAARHEAAADAAEHERTRPRLCGTRRVAWIAPIE